MNHEEYLELSSRTCSNDFTPYSCLVGIMGECGELVDMLKKQVWHGKTFSDETYAYEIGDLLWYTTNLSRISGRSQAFIDFMSRDKLIIPVDFVTPEDDEKYKFMLDKVIEALYISVRMALTDAVFISNTDILGILFDIYLLSFYTGYTMGEIMEMNIEKLKLRYPNGFVLGGGIR